MIRQGARPGPNDTTAREHALQPIEIATGIVFGRAPRPLPRSGTRRPAEALEAAVLAAVASRRCFVSFSGGRDSSAVLAAATAVARREGLPLPLPVTIRAAHAPESDESRWQESVVCHLRLTDWLRVDVQDELDAVGPYARRALARHGLLWPFNAHFHSPIFEQATGGTVLTGIGGDELWTSSTARPVSRRRRLLGVTPHRLRRTLLARRVRLDFPWLRPAGTRMAQRVEADDASATPRTARARMSQARGMRYIDVGTGALELLAFDAGALVAHPLLDLGLWSAVAAAAPRPGFGRSDTALSAVAGHLLPPDLVSRTTKASFDAVFFTEHARAWAREWTGGGAPADLVDEASLRAHWLGNAADAHSLTLLQAAWRAACRADDVPALSGTSTTRR